MLMTCCYTGVGRKRAASVVLYEIDDFLEKRDTRGRRTS